MSNKNNIKTPAAGQDTIRGLGKLGWTEGGKMHSTVKKLMSSFDDEVKPAAEPGRYHVAHFFGHDRKNLERTYNLNQIRKVMMEYVDDKIYKDSKK